MSLFQSQSFSFLQKESLLLRSDCQCICIREFFRWHSVPSGCIGKPLLFLPLAIPRSKHEPTPVITCMVLLSVTTTVLDADTDGVDAPLISLPFVRKSRGIGYLCTESAPHERQIHSPRRISPDWQRSFNHIIV